MRAHHTDGEAVDDPATLLRLGTEAGLPEAEIRSLLAGDEYAEQVREDLRQAARLGVTGVPFFLFDGVRAVAGAQAGGDPAGGAGRGVGPSRGAVVLSRPRCG